MRDGSSWRPSGASLLWIELALADMNASLRRKYGPRAGITFYRGGFARVLPSLAQQLRAHRVFVNARYEPAMVAADERVRVALAADGLQVCPPVPVCSGFLFLIPSCIPGCWLVFLVFS